jgi:hypothetical protein
LLISAMEPVRKLTERPHQPHIRETCSDWP